MKKILLIAISLMLFACSQNANKKEGVVASNQNAPVAKEGSAESKNNATESASLDPDKLSKDVAEIYSGIVISVVNKKDNTSKEISIPFTQRTAIEGTPLSIEVLSYFPFFKMVDNGGYANVSMDEENPGSKVKIYKDGKEIFNGWLFQKFPGMHGLDDADYDIVMVKSIKK